MRIHEYQAKKILSEYSILVPPGFTVLSENELEEVANTLGFPLVVKAQIHGGGRGKARGIRIVRTIEELRSEVRSLLGKRLVTSQSGEEGKYVGKVLVETFEEVKEELYLAILVDRDVEGIRLIASKKGGVNIEDVFREDPSLILTELIDPRYGLLPYKIRRVFFSLGLDFALLEPFSALCEKLYRAFLEKECLLCEINPLAHVPNKGFVAIDAKMVIDDNALFRHKDLAEMYDPTQEDSRELNARASGINYVRLKGNVGCVANGAGLAMATMDLVRMAGKEPANFLDVGGGATKEMVSYGLRLVHSDENVKVIFVNVFGGILRCDTFAMGFKDASPHIYKPVIMRLSGTNAEEGLRIVKETGSAIIVRDLKEALEKLKEIKV